MKNRDFLQKIFIIFYGGVCQVSPNDPRLVSYFLKEMSQQNYIKNCNRNTGRCTMIALSRKIHNESVLFLSLYKYAFQYNNRGKTHIHRHKTKQKILTKIFGLIFMKKDQNMQYPIIGLSVSSLLYVKQWKEQSGTKLWNT